MIKGPISEFHQLVESTIVNKLGKDLTEFLTKTGELDNFIEAFSTAIIRDASLHTLTEGRMHIYLKEDVKASIIKAVESEIDSRSFNGDKFSIDRAFIWSETKQGIKHWSDLGNSYRCIYF